MKQRLPLLLIGDTSTTEALGSKLIRGACVAGLNPNEEIETVYNSPATTYSPSMKRLHGKIFYRLADRRSWEWWRFQDHVKEIVRLKRPRLILVTGILPLKSEIFRYARSQGSKIVNYLTDDPWNAIHRRRLFLRNICLYDHIFSTKRLLEAKLRTAGARSTSWLPFAYDPDIHHPPKETHKTDIDIVFVGTGAKERLKWLEAVADIQGVRRTIHGNNWNGLSTPGWEQKPSVIGEEYCQAIYSARVVLGLLREGNGDQSTDRSYEIGAIGGCGLYKDSLEHRELLRSYPEEGFFNTPEELRKRVEAILINPELQEKLRAKGAEAMRTNKETYGERLRSIMHWSHMNE